MASVWFNPSGARCPMECRATEDLSESGVLLADEHLNTGRQRLSAASVLCSTQTQSAVISVCQGQSGSFL